MKGEIRMRKDGIWQLLSHPKAESPGENRDLNPVVVWIIIGAILFLIISSFWGESKEKPKPKESQVMEVREMEIDSYVEKLEERLKETLQKISGTGQVSVFINIEDSGERVLASDRSQKNQEDVDDAVEASRMEEESHVILWEQDGAETPYVVKERFPIPTGVLVVAEGAADAEVRQEIYEAVRAIFGLPAHRIKITN